MNFLRSVIFGLIAAVSWVESGPVKATLPSAISPRDSNETDPYSTYGVQLPNCTETGLNYRKSWNGMRNEEKKAFVDAELCLMSHPTILDNIEGAQNVWDQLHYTHIYEGNYIHYVGHFLPWHRYIVRVHEILLQTLCGYEGAHPYWPEAEDYATSKDMNTYPIFDPDTGLGGNSTGPDGCVTGPFANITLHMRQNNSHAEYCLYRSFNIDQFQGANYSNINECVGKTNYSDAWNCYNGALHGAGHTGTGGLMSNPLEAIGDPIFFMHHANLDRLWWKWQQQDLESRLTDMDGQNVPYADIIVSINASFPSADILDYNGDPANITTLNHVLWTEYIAPNVTVGQIMDLNGEVMCSEYVD